MNHQIWNQIGYCWGYFYLNKQKVKNDLLKNFSTNRQEQYWSIISYHLFIIFFMDRSYVYFFLFFGGNDSVSRQFLKIMQFFIMRIEISLWPWALFWSKDLIILTISSTQNSKDESLSLVSKFIFTRTVLSLDIGVHCLAQKLLKRFALSKKSVISCYLPVVVVSLESYCHLQMFSNGPVCFWGCFRVTWFISITFMIFQFGRTYKIWYI